MAIFRIDRKDKVERNNKDHYIGPANNIVFLQEEKDIMYMRGLSVDLIVCNFARTTDTDRDLKPYITDGYYQTGIIKYLK